MIDDIIYLWTQRERPERAGLIFRAWAKRLVTLPLLLKGLFRKWLILRRGGKIGRLSAIGVAKFTGNFDNLMVGDGASVGRCEIVLHAQVQVGHHAVISDGVVLLTASHDVMDRHWRTTKKPIRIGDHAWIATNAIVLPGVTIGRGGVVGAGSVVRADVPDFAIVIGNPAILVERCRRVEFEYCPAFLNASYAAWLGPRRHI